MRLHVLGSALVAALFAFGVSGSAFAMGSDTPAQPSSSAPKQDGSKTSKPAKKKEQKKDAKKEQQSQLEFEKNYRVAYDLIYTDHDYAAGIDKLRALHRDDHPDVANLIGYSSRKLGRYDDSKVWYERALAADPKHARTWSYYGMWHAEQGNLLKAKDYLAKVASICGTECREYTELKGVIDGTKTY